MHPKEFKHEKAGTGRLTHLCLGNSEIHMGLNFDADGAVQELITDPANFPVLVYPGPTARNLTTGALAPAELGGRRLVLILLDGTWSGARKMLRLSPSLQKLPRVMFTPTAPSRFLIKQQPQDGCLSTLETAHELLLALTSSGLDTYALPAQLLDLFARMQAFQMEQQAKKNADKAAKRAQELAIAKAKKARKMEKAVADAAQLQALTSRTAVLEADSRAAHTVSSQVEISRSQTALLENQSQEMSLMRDVLTVMRADAARNSEADARRDIELGIIRQNQLEMSQSLRMLADTTRDNTTAFLNHLKDREAEHTRQLQLGNQALQLRDQAVQQLMTEFHSGHERRDAALRALQDAFQTVLSEQQYSSHEVFQQSLQDQQQYYLVTMQHNLDKFVAYLKSQHGAIGDITSHQAVLDNMQKVLLQFLTQQPMLTSFAQSTRRLTAAAAPTFSGSVRSANESEHDFLASLASSPTFATTESSASPSAPSSSGDQGQRGVRRQLLASSGAAASAGGPSTASARATTEGRQTISPSDFAELAAWRATGKRPAPK
jgi:DTW domain-containing protein YfiP